MSSKSTDSDLCRKSLNSKASSSNSIKDESDNKTKKHSLVAQRKRELELKFTRDAQLAKQQQFKKSSSYNFEIVKDKTTETKPRSGSNNGIKDYRMNEGFVPELKKTSEEIKRRHSDPKEQTIPNYNSSNKEARKIEVVQESSILSVEDETRKEKSGVEILYVDEDRSIFSAEHEIKEDQRHQKETIYDGLEQSKIFNEQDYREKEPKTKTVNLVQDSSEQEIKQEGPDQSSTLLKEKSSHSKNSRDYEKKISEVLSSEIAPLLKREMTDQELCMFPKDVSIKLRIKFKSLFENYKIVVNLTISRNLGEPFSVSSKCFWDNLNDTVMNYLFTDTKYFCLASVFLFEI